MKKKAIWITGASSGIGKALTEKFAENELHVIGTARRFNSVEQRGNVTLIKNDVSNYEDVIHVYETLNKNFDIVCLINNAGTTEFKSFTDTDIEEIERILKVNLHGAIYTTKAVLPEMIKRNRGTIINILSVAANTVFTNSTVYSASKAGLEMFGKVLREELRTYNIKVLNIYPGATATEIWPVAALKRFSEQMMKPEVLADFIYNVYQSDFSLSPEEITIRPIGGDL